jgi:hypothetical protein
VLLFGFRVFYRIVTLLIAAAVVYLVVTGVQVEIASRATRLPSRAEHAAAIVVTGTPGTPNMSADYRAKLRIASSLFSRRLAPLLIVAVPSGASRAGALSAQRTKEFGSILKPHQVAAVLAADAGKEFSRVEKRIGRGHRVIIVTDAINALYMESCAASDGLVPEVVAPPASKKTVFSQISSLLRETSGVAVGRVIGFGNATWATK